MVRKNFEILLTVLDAKKNLLEHDFALFGANYPIFRIELIFLVEILPETVAEQSFQFRVFHHNADLFLSFDDLINFDYRGMFLRKNELKNREETLEILGFWLTSFL